MRISDPDHDDAEKLRLEFQQHRAAAVFAFAEAEFAMGDLLLAMEASGRFSKIEFRYTVESRLEQFRAACLQSAADKTVVEYAESACRGFKNSIDDRNALVHGSATLFPDLKRVEVLKISPSKSDRRRMEKLTYNLETMKDRVSEFDHICRTIIALSWAVAISQGLSDHFASGATIYIESK